MSRIVFCIAVVAVGLALELLVCSAFVLVWKDATTRAERLFAVIPGLILVGLTATFVEVVRWLILGRYPF